ncbi:MAG: hypothetical protein WC879_17360 [Melioribacteraceae bacterium]
MLKKNSKDYQLLMETITGSAKIEYQINVFGDVLAERMKYKVHSGLDAIHYYLIEKYHWQLSYVRSLKIEELDFLLAEERDHWQMPNGSQLP